MATDLGYPVSVLLDGPLFRDELESQYINVDADIDRLRLVPSKSAATGVHTIYFRPEHRQWALVRLATRYRGLFEIQLQRGMSGEHQLLRQGFTSDDLQFLFDIIPQPPEQYSPVVYDMLWLVATYDEYLTLARAMVDRDEFVPANLLSDTAGVSMADDGFFTRFLRSHLVRPKVERPDSSHKRSNPEKSDLSIDRTNVYEVTPEGQDALEGIVAEYDRIFEDKEFDPLLINPELDPLEHLREYERSSVEPERDVSFDEMQEDDGILSDIAESFAPLDDDIDGTSEPDEGTEATQRDKNGGSPASETPDARQSHEESIPDDATVPRGTHSVSGPIPSTERDGSTETGGSHSLTEPSSGRRGTNRTDAIDPAQGDQPPETSMVGEFTEDEVKRAAVAAAMTIRDGTLVRTADVKATVWDEVDVEDRSRGEFWDIVRELLLEMDAVHGRVDGHVWAADTFGE